MPHKRIYSQKTGALNEQDRLALASMLLKAGYTARVGREKPAGKANSQYVYYVEYWEEDDR
jgi:hypothetical protein